MKELGIFTPPPNDCELAKKIKISRKKHVFGHELPRVFCIVSYKKGSYEHAIDKNTGKGI